MLGLFSIVATSFLHGLHQSSSRLERSRHVRLCTPEEDILAQASAPTASMAPEAITGPYDKATEAALRATKLDFGGYPPKKYYEIQAAGGEAKAYASVRKDHPVLSNWSDIQIRDAISELKPTLAEILIQTPIGPFLVLSAIAIFRDGLSAWGVPPCREYIGACAALAEAFK